ncbi:MAG: DUF4013 domain-containing protein [bacterium]|nr:DUF4013 domain-containing protein [bacterium]
MDYARAFKYPFENEGWLVKCLIAFGLCVTCIGAPCTVGYMLRAARNAAVNKPLPDWEDYGGLWMEGFRIGIMQLGYTFPGLLIMMLAGGLGGGMMAFSNSDGAAGGSMLVMIAGLGVGGIVAFIGGVFASVAYLLLMREGASLGDAFAIGKVQNMLFSNLGSVVMFFILAIVTNTIASVLGQLTFGIGLLIASPYAMMVTAHLYGQLANIVMPYELG